MANHCLLGVLITIRGLASSWQILLRMRHSVAIITPTQHRVQSSRRTGDPEGITSTCHCALELLEPSRAKEIFMVGSYMLSSEFSDLSRACWILLLRASKSLGWIIFPLTKTFICIFTVLKRSVGDFTSITLDTLNCSSWLLILIVPGSFNQILELEELGMG
ncbi:hypothetical protein Tco_1555341 [Tanacetum coccineum]